ncbi:hypothetical protein PU52_15350 [Escherichia coli]|nr:hypothetical protein PU52_15350 [Escherichia coli]
MAVLGTVAYSHRWSVGGGTNSLMQKICKIGSNWKSFNTRTIGSSPASRSTFLHTTCLRLYHISYEQRVSRAKPQL